MRKNADRDIRRVQALELRLGGASYREIGAQLGVACGTAFKDVQAMLKLTCQEAANTVRQVELLRLDKLLKAIWPAALQGDFRAVATALAILARRATMLGLDAPARIDITTIIRERARAEGLDEVEAVRVAEEIVRGIKWE